MKRLMLIIAGTGLALVPAASASGIRECGNWAWTGTNVWHGWWTYGIGGWNNTGGYSPIYNLTTRNVRCSDARHASVNIMRYHTPPFGSHYNTH